MVYLASPYSHKSPVIRERRYRMVTECAAHFIKRGSIIFSPITHSHPIALCGHLPGDFDYWEEFDQTIIKVCREMWILTLAGWRESHGIRKEIAIFEAQNAPIRYVAYHPEAYCDGVVFKLSNEEPIV